MSLVRDMSQSSKWGFTLTAGSPRQRVLLLIICSALIRIVFAATVDLGVDEAYLVATGRQLALSVYDHPPLAWWIGWIATHAMGSDAALAVRLPFILFFVATTWQMYRLGEYLFDEEAGFWSALALNCAPVLGVTSATWAVPDGPLMLGLVSATLCLARVLFDKNASPTLWLGAGFWGGVALLSKYHGVFLFVGALLFILSSAQYRRWLFSPWPYLGTLLALLMFSPVLIWNAQHGWVSFGFQSARGAVVHLRLWRPFVALGGQALFLFPPLWLALVFAFYRALAARPRDDHKWLLVCLGIGPVVLFTFAAAWSKSVFFHWAAPGYLMWMPLLGERLSSWTVAFGERKRRILIINILAIPALVLCVSIMAALPVRWVSILGHDPFSEVRSLGGLRDEMAKRGLMTKDLAFIAAVKWHQAGRLDYALHGEMPVTCLCEDARGYSIIAPLDNFRGQSGIIIVPREKAAALESLIASQFIYLERLDDFQQRHNGEIIDDFAMYKGIVLRWP